MVFGRCEVREPPPLVPRWGQVHNSYAARRCDVPAAKTPPPPQGSRRRGVPQPSRDFADEVSTAELERALGAGMLAGQQEAACHATAPRPHSGN